MRPNPLAHQIRYGKRRKPGPRHLVLACSHVRPQMHTEGPPTGVQADCERVLRTLPRWFGIGESLLEYATNSVRLPTFVAKDEATVVEFLSLQQHFPESWEVNFIAIDLAYRRHGLGRQLQACAEDWLSRRGAYLLHLPVLPLVKVLPRAA